MPGQSLSLKDLIRLTFPEPVAWLAGERQAARAVRWAALSLDELQPEDVLVAPAAQLSPELLARAREQQAAAVLLVGPAALPEDAAVEDLPVIAVAGQPGDVREVQRLMLTILISQRAALMERGVRIHAQLSQIEVEGQGLDGLARAMAEISGRGVLVQDKRGQVLAGASSSTLMSIWPDVVQSLGRLESLPDFLLDRKRAVSHDTAMRQKVPGGLERLVAPIIVGEMARGYLSLIGLDGELDELDDVVTEQGGLVCAVEMARNKAIRETEKRLKGDLLTALLQEDLSPRDARLWVQAMGMDLSQSHAALRFAWEGPSPPSRRRLETLVNGEVNRMGLPVIVSPMGTEIICFCQVPSGEERPVTALALGQAVLEQARREYSQVRALCGIGKVAEALEAWRNSFRQAGQALEMARRLEERRPLVYADLSVYRLLFQIEHSPELIAFEEETLGPLLSYEGSGELIHTLEAYFEHNGNLSQTADALFIHRNTLVYRLERIAAITHLDLDEPENRLAIQLALRIYRMLGSQGHSP